MYKNRWHIYFKFYITTVKKFYYLCIVVVQNKAGETRNIWDSKTHFFPLYIGTFKFENDLLKIRFAQNNNNNIINSN